MDSKDAKIGTVVQVIGPVVDVKFEGGALPEIYTAIKVTSEGFDVTDPICIIVEVEQHIGEDRVRCVSMHPT
ncbi:MAG: F0F1 ATP synthase subunit beta, partial [Candidatus Aminicenantales bacterium]